MLVLGLEGGCEAGRPGTTPVLPTLLSLHRLDNVHGSRVEPSETARMNSMDRHIQQTNDRLQCIKQVGAWLSPLPPPSSVEDRAVGVLACAIAGYLGLWVEVLMGMSLLPGVP